MTERERLVELILECDKSNEVLSCFNERPRKRQAAEILADHLLANGVIVLPAKVGDTVYCDIEEKNNGDFLDECIVKIIEFDRAWEEPLYTVVCYEKANYQRHWASGFGERVFREPQFGKKKQKRLSQKEQSMNENELLSCPFCGGKATPWEVFMAKKPWQILCRCGGRVGWFLTKEEAVKAWNRRATDEKAD